MYRMGWASARLRESGRNVVNYWPNDESRIQGNVRYSPITEQEHLVEMWNTPDEEICVFQRPANRVLIEAMRMLKDQGHRIVVEVDDDLPNVHVRNLAYSEVAGHVSPDMGWRYLIEAFELADWRVFSTDALFERYGRTGDFVVRNYVPASYLEMEPSPENIADLLAQGWDGEPRIGWAGFVGTHPEDLEVVGDGVKRVCRWLNSPLRVIGPPEGVAHGVQMASRDVWATGFVPTLEYGAAVRAGFDVGIAPLARNKFNDAKSWLKPLEYASLGIPSVVSPSPEYLRLAEQLPIVVASTPKDWFRCLRGLVSDPVGLKSRSDELRGQVRDLRLTIEDRRDEFWAAWTGQPLP